MSVVDKDARHGAKSDEKKFTGYKVNSIMSEDGFIKNINATPGNSYDGDILIPLIDEMIEHGFNASEVVGDTAYGEVEVPLQKIRAFYKIIENLHIKVILVIKLRLKSHLKEIIIASKYTKIIFATEPDFLHHNPTFHEIEALTSSSTCKAKVLLRPRSSRKFIKSSLQAFMYRSRSVFSSRDKSG